jgi:hypothetical protein
VPNRLAFARNALGYAGAPIRPSLVMSRFVCDSIAYTSLSVSTRLVLKAPVLLSVHAEYDPVACRQ